ncbi:MAG: glycosyl hydrolase family 18 protein [Patescibacteria group bacterium]
MFIDRDKIISVYLSCALLFGLVLIFNHGQNLETVFLKPLDDSYSILGSRSVFKDLTSGNRVYAFLPYWNLGHDVLNVDTITDLSYFGLNVDAKGRIVTNDVPYKKWREDKRLAETTTKVKKNGGRVSLTLVCHVEEDIDAVLFCTDCWSDLAKDLERELVWAGIKDVNVDFEYPFYTTPENAQKYSQLVGFLNNYLDTTFGDSFVVVSAYADSADRAVRDEVRLTDLKSLAANVDAIFIMAYDFHRPESANAGPVSPLEGSYKSSRLNLTTAVESYLKVVSANKLILGLPFYGYNWIVEDLSPMSARIEGNDTIGFSKSISYAEVTDLLIKKQLKPSWDDLAKTPYVNYIDAETGSNRQVWYDNAESLKYKVALAQKNHFLGVGVWAVGYEGGYANLWNVFKPF